MKYNYLSKIFFLFLLSSLCFSQADWQKWEAQEISYQIPSVGKTIYYFNNSSVGSFVLSSARNAYKFFISDLDGDNCPFSPTCSSFFIEAAQETNIFQGALMFADRFTRDLNLLKAKNHYSLTVNNHFYDPVKNYMLQEDKIKIILISEAESE